MDTFHQVRRCHQQFSLGYHDLQKFHDYNALKNFLLVDLFKIYLPDTPRTATTRIVTKIRNCIFISFFVGTSREILRICYEIHWFLYTTGHSDQKEEKKNETYLMLSMWTAIRCIRFSSLIRKGFVIFEDLTCTEKKFRRYLYLGEFLDISFFRNLHECAVVLEKGNVDWSRSFDVTFDFLITMCDALSIRAWDIICAGWNLLLFLEF